MYDAATTQITMWVDVVIVSKTLGSIMSTGNLLVLVTHCSVSAETIITVGHDKESA